MLNFSRSEKLKIINLETQKNILSVKEGQTFDKEFSGKFKQENYAEEYLWFLQRHVIVEILRTTLLFKNNIIITRRQSIDSQNIFII